MIASPSLAGYVAAALAVDGLAQRSIVHCSPSMSSQLIPALGIG